MRKDLSGKYTQKLLEIAVTPATIAAKKIRGN